MNPGLEQKLNQLVRRIEGRPQAEKIIGLLMIVSAMIMGYLTWVYDPLTAARAAAAQDIAAVEQQIQAQQAAYSQKVAQSQEDPNRFANERLSVIRVEQEQLDREISGLAGELVTPSNMTRILTAALQGHEGLELVQIQNSSAEPLRTGVDTQPGALLDETETAASRVIRNVSGQVYRHGISLEFRGDYFSTLRYLLLLEQLTDSFYWDSITFTQSQWPSATVRLQLHTLSTEAGFLGA